MKLISIPLLAYFVISVSFSFANLTVDLNLLKNLKNFKHANLIVSFGSIEPILNQINNEMFNSRDERISRIFNSLTSTSQNVQFNVIQSLKRKNLKFKTFWITNQIYIEKANLSTIRFLEQFPEISSIAEEILFQRETNNFESIKYGRTARNNEWGVVNVDAPQAWDLGYKGRGVKVGIIDTGVRWTHEGLISKMADGHNWFDPSTLNPIPYDNTGFGTHSTGIILGSPNIGVAPEAKYISCLGCPEGTCSQSNLIDCGQFITCPHDTNGNNPNCSQTPDIVSNGWLHGRGQTWFDAVINTWRAAGIIPVFSIGNTGPGCGTTNSPGDNLKAIGVGAISQANMVFPPSSRGPSSFGGVIKPDVAAPGFNVVSAHHASDSSFATFSGTSLAAAHVSGVIAILKSKNITADYYTILNAMRAGSGFVTSTGQNCGGVNDENLPNNNVGAGRVSAFRSLNNV